MVFGGVNRERIQLNEETLWYGYRCDNGNPAAAKALPEVKRLMFAVLQKIARWTAVD